VVESGRPAQLARSICLRLPVGISALSLQGRGKRVGEHHQTCSPLPDSGVLSPQRSREPSEEAAQFEVGRGATEGLLSDEAMTATCSQGSVSTFAPGGWFSVCSRDQWASLIGLPVLSSRQPYSSGV
jgi:hypothetical protein